MELISLISVIIGLIVLVYLVCKDTSLLIAAPVASIFVLIFSRMNLVESIMGPYCTSLGNFITKNLLIIMTGSIFGSMMGETGAAQDIAHSMTGMIDKIKVKNKKFCAMMILTAVFMVLNYGGISGYVIVFTMVPICKRIFKEYDIPWHLYLAVHSFGSLVTQAMLPGTPAVQNLIPMEYLGTTPSAAPMLGTATALVFCVPVAALYCYFALRQTMKKGEGFMVTGSRINETILEEDANGSEEHGSFIKAIIAPVVVLVLLNVVKLNASFTLVIGTLTALVLYFNKVKKPMDGISKSATSGAKIAIGIASIVGFGGIVAATPGYTMLIGGLQSIPGSPLIQLVLAVNAVAAITGSASGGESIALETFGQHYVNMGFPPEVLHRLTAISSLGLDSLPHNGSVVNQMEYARLTYANGYKHIFWIACIIPFLAGFVAVGFYSMGII
jgi:H+/gluconate symporter-like permease